MTRQENNEEYGQMLEDTEGNMREVEVKDKYYLNYILFYALGTLTLVPHNFFVTANDYWMYKFRDTSVPYNASNKNDRTNLQALFTSNFSIVANVTSVVLLIITIALAKKISIRTRIISTTIAMTILFLLTILMVPIDTDSYQPQFFAYTLITGSLLNGSGGMFMVTLFQLVGKFPAKFLGAQLSGQAICGIFSALVQIFSLGIGATPQINATTYFSIGALCVVLTLLSFILMSKYSEFFNHYANMEVEENNKPKPTRDDVKRIFSNIKYLLATMILVLSCSVMMHPNVTSLVQSVGSGSKWNSTFFVPVCTYLSYYTFDFIGRELAPIISQPKNSIIMLILAVLRMGFIPLFMYCNVQPRNNLPVGINSDTAYIIFIIIFAISNGYLVNLCILQVPKVTEEDDKNIALFLIVIFMVVSLGVCSFFSVLIINGI